MRLGCLASHEPLWSQRAGDVGTPEAVTVHSKGPASVRLDHPARECRSRKAREMEALIALRGGLLPPAGGAGRGDWAPTMWQGDGARARALTPEAI